MGTRCLVGCLVLAQGQCQPLVGVALRGARMTFSRPTCRDVPWMIGLWLWADALARLRSDERRLIRLRYVSGFTSVELAESPRLTPDGVRTRLKRILDRLRKELRDG